jgi:uncharacterized membrane protein
MTTVVDQRPHATYVAGSGTTEAPAPARLTSLDLVRGLVVVIMAIDHVRVYSGQPAGGPTPGIFFTRWITHFVAPIFVFLAGTAAYLHGQRLLSSSGSSRAALSRFLVTRGLWLVLLELTVIRVSWTFNFDYAHYMLAGVIWMIGWCMVLMAVAVQLPVVAVGAIGVAIVFGHNLADVFASSLAPLSGNPLFKVLYFGGGLTDAMPILFVLVPWIGVMMSGYAFGTVMRMTPARRRSICLALGVGATMLFIVLRALDGYGDPRHWSQGGNAPALLRFLGTTKYPASLLFLLMTLGPMFLLLPFVENTRGRVANMFVTFGRVPFFYYLLHIPVIHLLACAVSLVREGRVNPWLFGNHPMAPPEVPPGYMWSLPLLYLVFAIAIAVLYVPCRWYANVKATRKSAWLSYL